ncbi:hypothetical protein [Siphonobacter sp. SORGH_AS_1065]|uniref:hypothetical protein n=1 Tax=Siphonobacter sp. SORGH_AS_1065 TaxID=3041795 RepID=UPI002785A35A|nr:hypothetical protein [Siphonobacter sp. SORGH_AS_1065]MDQ1088981.1 hypothetical protein [Siphonobacter sp. SORGH_AS_1065]
MLDIRIEGHSVELTPGMALTLEKFNPLLDFTTIQGARVYGFNLPDTPKNRRIMGHFYNPQTGYKNRRYTCEKYVDSQLIERGSVKIYETTSAGWSLYFIQNLGEIFGDLQTINLSEIDFGTLPIPATRLTEAVCFPAIHNAGFYGNQAVEGFSGVVNQVDSSVARVPMVFLNWLLDQFGQLVGWRFDGEYFQDPIAAQLILANLFSLDELSEIKVQNHLPEMTMGGLLIELRKLLNLYLDFDVRRQICGISFADDILKAPTLLDWTAKANLVHTKIPESVNRLELSYEIDSNDALLKPIPMAMDKYITAETAVNEGGSTLPIKSRFSTCLVDPESGLALTSQAGISPRNKDSQAKGTPKLLLWDGDKATAVSSDNSLFWHGPNSLPARRWSQFERFKANTFLLRKVLYLSPADLATFSFKNKVHIKGVNYLVGSMKATLTADQKIVPVEVELWKV